jgi:hypothetical protein
MPARSDHFDPFRTDAFDFRKPSRVGIDDLESINPKVLDDSLGVGWADSFDQS